MSNRASGQQSGVHLAANVTLAGDRLDFRFARSGGPGGQNVNKLATRVTLTVLIEDLAAVMPAAAVGRLKKLAGQRLADDPPRIVIRVADSRSQRLNRQSAIERLSALIQQAMRKPRRRVATKPTATSRQKRLEEKKQRGQLKQSRRSGRDTGDESRR